METYRMTEKNYKLLKSLPLFKDDYSIIFDDANAGAAEPPSR